MFSSFHSDPPTVVIAPIIPKDEVWVAAEEVEMEGELNAGLDTVLANVRHNTRLGFQQVQPYPTNNVEVMLVGGVGTTWQLGAPRIDIRQDGRR